MVQLNDYNIIKANFGTDVASRELGDVTGDGVVNLLDFGQWKDNFPLSGSASGSAAAQVPEPTSAAVGALVVALGAALPRIRRRSRRR
jgi:hypothetical protein